MIFYDFVRTIESGDAKKVKLLITTFRVNVNERFHNCGIDTVPLVLATRLGHTSIVELLLSFGAHVNSAGRDGQTACFCAAERGRADILAVLIAHRADLGCIDAAGLAPIDIAFKRSHEHCVAMLIRADAPLDRARSCKAAAMGVESVQALMDRGIVVRELRNGRDCTPCHLAIRRECVDLGPLMHKLVHVCGIDVNAVDAAGDTCSHVAVVHGMVDCLRWLILAGADIDIVNTDDHYSPLHEASFYGREECVLLLLAAGADVQARTVHGPACCLATQAFIPVENSTAILQLLIACGVDIDFPNAGGESTRQAMASRCLVVTDDGIEAARRRIAKERVDFVRYRALQVCVGLQSRGLDALQMCEILQHACGPVAHLIAFHQWWKIATTVKHFKLK
jgi:ankyrin repeat protein